MNKILTPWFSQPDKPGYFAKLTFDRYKKIPAVNASLLKLHTAASMEEEIPDLLESNVDEDDDESSFEKKEKKHFALGETAHKAVLEPEIFENDGWEAWFQYSPTKSLDTKAAAAARIADPDRLLITPEIRTKALQIRDAVYRHDHAREYLKNTNRELSGIVWDAEHEICRKVRVDARSGKGGDYILDLKTTRCDINSVIALRSETFKLGYDIQAAFYLDTDKMLVPTSPRTRFLIVFVTTNTRRPRVRLFEIPPAMIEAARKKYLERLGMFMQAAHDNQWSAYEHEEVVTFPFTEWQPS